MIVNKTKLMELSPIKDMHEKKIAFGLSHGLSHAGYDITLKQRIRFIPYTVMEVTEGTMVDMKQGRFTLASAVEYFQMPKNLVGVVHDKSTLARKGIQVFNTIIEPNWNGYLTLELVFNGEEEIILEAGTPIAQVIFHELAEEGEYDGKYQNQDDRPVADKLEKIASRNYLAKLTTRMTGSCQLSSFFNMDTEYVAATVLANSLNRNEISSVAYQADSYYSNNSPYGNTPSVTLTLNNDYPPYSYSKFKELFTSSVSTLLQSGEKDYTFYDELSSYDSKDQQFIEEVLSAVNARFDVDVYLEYSTNNETSSVGTYVTLKRSK